jgi:GNAT superfamily N-acetyltransferase
MPELPDCVTLKRLDPTAERFRDLTEESRLEGYWMLVRLLDGWESGRNRFSKRGETLLAAWRGGELAGVCGLNVDPYVDKRREGRVRHLYVKQAHRRAGVGRMLVGAVIEKAARHFPMLNARAPEEAFSFYGAPGFRRVEGEEFVTHRLVLRRPSRRSRARKQ